VICEGECVGIFECAGCFRDGVVERGVGAEHGIVYRVAVERPLIRKGRFEEVITVDA